MTRARRVLVLAALVAVAAVLVADVLPSVAATARRMPGMTRPGASSEAHTASHEAAGEASGRGERVIELSRVVVADVRERTPSAPDSPKSPNSTWVVEYATYTFRSNSEEAVFVLAGVREAAVRPGTNPEAALRDAGVQAQRQTAQSVLNWATANGATNVNRESVRAAVAELTTTVQRGREDTGDVMRVPCPDGSKASCRASDLLAGLVPARR